MGEGCHSGRSNGSSWRRGPAISGSSRVGTNRGGRRNDSHLSAEGPAGDAVTPGPPDMESIKVLTESFKSQRGNVWTAQ